MKPNSAKYDNLIFYSSIALIIVGGGLSTFVPYSLFFYYLPAIILVVGIILVWFTNRKIKTKAIWTVSPFLVFCAFWFIWYLDKKVDPEIFLLPDGYSGKVNIVYNQDCGQPEEWEKDSRVYRIPETGILLTQFQDEQGLIDHSYFFVDQTGRRIPIPNLDVRDYNEEWTTIKKPKRTI
jgi:hypothetical protein